MEQIYAWQDVHRFWFPDILADAGHNEMVAMAKWWMQGGATPELPRFLPTVRAAMAGNLDHWCVTPQGRLSLIIVLDQFTRGLFAGTPQAYAADPAALALAEEGMRSGDYHALTLSGEQAFAEMPLLHTEGPGHLERIDFMIALAKTRAAAAPSQLKQIMDFTVAQREGNRAVIERFGRFPHRNTILGRSSTPEEQEYLAAGNFVHEQTPTR